MNRAMSSESAVAQDNISMVLEVSSEPSYISEIARKLIKHDPEWDMSLMTAIDKVSSIVSMLEERDEFHIHVIDYGTDDMGQEESSPMFSIVDSEEKDGWQWYPYTLVHYEVDVDLRPTYQDIVDQSVTVDEKVGLINTLSSKGNDIAKQSEEIMQDVMKRQFKHFENVETPDYNDPGVDFYVEDDYQRDWGLCIEISTRYVNPIDWPYFDNKMQKSMDKDADLLIMAPKFTDELLNEYEDHTEDEWHEDPLDQIGHLHRVPPDEPTVYSPFSKDPDEIVEGDDEGNPIIIADSESSRKRLSETGNVGDDYPVVDGDYGDMLEALGRVGRDFVVVTESQYRNSMREALEPLLWNFMRPYMIEQFLNDMYWNEDLSQKKIGKLVDRSTSTITDWMGRWDIMTRGGGAPELSDEVIDIWSRMYRGDDPFDEQFSGYRIQAEYNRRPLWDIDDWEEWYQDTTDDERKDIVADQSSHHESITYTLMYGPEDRLQPSYRFIMQTLKRNGVEVRPPDEAPRGAYNAYPSKKALEYMINVDDDTIVEIGE